MRVWLVSCLLGVVATAAVAQGGARSVWDGVYTEAQAARGASVSAEKCARCHGQALLGAEAAPALTGDGFNASWEGVPLDELAERIRVSMPQDAPGSLSRQQTVDLLAYMLKVGSVPAGSTELVTDANVLAQIMFTGNRP